LNARSLQGRTCLFFVRILQINSARTFAGGERHFADLANALRQRGHEVYAALAPDSPLTKTLNALPTQNIINVRMRNALDLGSAIELARVIRDNRIEIVHAHLARDYTLAAFAVRKQGGARLVFTRHLLLPLNKFHRITFRSADCVIAVSESVARRLKEQKIFPHDKIRVVLNGIETEQFNSQARSSSSAGYFSNLSLSGAAHLVGITGELREHKGQEDFVRAAAVVRKRFPDAHFLIAGEDRSEKREFRARLDDLISMLKLEGHVHFVGWLESVAEFLFALDVFVSASRTEPFGLAIVEAMASGLGVVATKSEGAREIIEDDVSGKLVPIGDAEKMAEAICGLLSDEHERKHLGENARLAARKRFDIKRMVDETEAIYDELINEMNCV